MARIAYLCTDLLFTSKIRETAAALGHSAAGSRDSSGLSEAARGCDLVVVDLRLAAALDALERLRAAEETREVPVVGFCDHQRTDLMERARQAGCDRVLSKGNLASELRLLLSPGGEAKGGPGG